MDRQLRYPDLPIVERRDDVVAALRAHQVVVVAGETGSGKSTQLPKMCLEAGLAEAGMIGHTQPRRLAARTVAERIADELGEQIGGTVGYTVRFTDKVRRDTRIKVMTDGILLAELQRDRMLRRYRCLIVDEAHERSLNIDFILGYLKQLLPKRRDLTVVITSATIDTARFSAHFDDAPVIEVSGRSFPVEVRYRPPDPDTDQIQAINDAVDLVMAEGPGDILVFLSGEREIRDTADALEGRGLRNVEIVPLFARLSSADQHRVFQPHTGRRIVLATNVAETSLTVPGIVFVIDPGFARISRYNRRTKVQRLPIEAISQASADQRAGRCGRVAPGTCIRLYEEDDFARRPEFTEPEILRTNLASVILQMTAIGLGDVARFPFVDRPDGRAVKDGVALLEELGALTPSPAGGPPVLTAIGRRLAQLPVDPRFGRMVLEAERHGCVDDVVVIAAALSIQDPRERPAGKEQAAAELHRRFADDSSDFVSILNLWRYLREQQAALGSSAFRRLCKQEHLHFLRVREWQDVHGQLRQAVRGMGIHLTEGGHRDHVHQSLLAGLLSHIGMRDVERNEYRGTRGATFAINPGSVLAKKSPRWVMAAELVETNRLWARVVAPIQPEWAESLGEHLVTRSYSEAWWDPARGTALATERVSLYGLPIVTNRRAQVSRIDPRLAREMLIRCALVDGEWQSHHAFVAENQRRVDEVRSLENRVRRRDILVDDETLFEFFDARIPDSVVSVRHFDRWYKAAEADLTYPRELLFEHDVDPAGFPDTWTHGELELPITYVFDPADDLDGAVVDIPIAALPKVAAAGFDWHVPGFRVDLVTALIRALPRDLRRDLAPVPEHARAFVARTSPSDGPLLDVLERELHITGWPIEQVPAHLRVTFRAVDEQGAPVAWSKDLDALKDHLRSRIEATVTSAARSLERSGERTWAFGDLPREVHTDVGGHTVTAYPALVDEGETVGVRTFTSAADQQRAHRQGLRRLLRLTVPPPARQVARTLQAGAGLAMAGAPRGVHDDIVSAAVDALLEPVWTGDDFTALRARVRDHLPRVAGEIARTVADVLVELRAAEQRLGAVPSTGLHALEDVSAQLGRLVFPGFVSAAGADRIADVHRYLRAVGVRLDALPKNPARDRDRTERVQRLERIAGDRMRWELEELRVSLFAQSVGAKGKVSEERILRELRAG